MKASGADQTNISLNGFSDFSPDVSPGSNKIVFVSNRDQSGDNIHVMDINGSNVRQITTGSGQRAWPRGSPTGLIAFSYPFATLGEAIWTVKYDGTGLRQITNPGPEERDGGGHDFYHNGRMLIFSRLDSKTKTYDLFSVPTDGSGSVQRITGATDSDEAYPVVSHDGRYLAYVIWSTPPSPTTWRIALRILRVGSWTLEREIVIDPPMMVRWVEFSRNNKRLYFEGQSPDVAATGNDKYEIYSIKTDGTDLKRLTYNQFIDLNPSVEPCGSLPSWLCGMLGD
jgi:Tol biopolymer transport system component